MGVSWNYEGGYVRSIFHPLSLPLWKMGRKLYGYGSGGDCGAHHGRI